MAESNSTLARVRTGYSYPKVAQYSVDATHAVTYSGLVDLALGVEINITAESTGRKIFRANNGPQISAPRRMTGGTITSTCSHPVPSVLEFIEGTPTPGADGVVVDDDTVKVPYLGYGYIVRYMLADGSQVWRPFLITKVQFLSKAEGAKTEEEEIDFQSEVIEFSIFRDDSPNHTWRKRGKFWETEQEALTELDRVLFGIAAQGGST